MAETSRIAERFKRPASGLWAWTERMYIPMPLSLKIKVMRTARELAMSQAELGLIIVDSVLADDALLRHCLSDRERSDQNGQS